MTIMSAGQSSISIGRWRVLLSLVIMTIGGAVGWLAAQDQQLTVVILAISVLLLVMLSFRPQMTTPLVLFGIYLNLPVVAVQLHGAPRFIPPFFILMLVVPVATYLLHREKLVYDRILFWMFLFLAAKAVSTVFAFDTAIAIEELTNYVLEGMALYFLVLNIVRDEVELRRVVWAIMLAAAVMGAVALFQEVTQTFDNNYGGLAQRRGSFETEQEGEWRDRIAGPLNEPNFFAQILLVAVPLGLFRFRGEQRQVLRVVALCAAILATIGVFLTYSRGGALALFAAFAVTAYLWRLKPHHLLLSGIALLGIVVLAAPNFLGRIQSIGQAQALVSADSGRPEDKSIEGRYVENMAAVFMFLDHPVLGVGPGNYRELYVEYAIPIGGYVRYYGRPAHNLYLSFAAELGLVGLTIFLMLVGTQMYRLIRLRQLFEHSQTGVVNYAMALFASMVGYLVSGIFLHLAYQRYFWILMALASAVVSIGMRSARQHTTMSPSIGSPHVAMQEPDVR